MKGETLYDVLGIRKKASAEEIKKAYKQLALQHHPDRGTGSPEAFKKIASAYEVLGDPRQRKLYDDGLQKPKPVSSSFGTTVIRPTRPVRQAFVCECIDGAIRTFDVDSSVFPGSLSHGDHIVVESGDTGTVLGVTEDAVWWWKNGCSYPSLLGGIGCFSPDSINPVRWRKTGNYFKSKNTRQRQAALEQRRNEELRKFKTKQMEKERQEAKKKKLNEKRKQLEKQLHTVVLRETQSRHRWELLLLVQLQEVHKRVIFSQRVAVYWQEVKQVMDDMLASQKETVGSTLYTKFRKECCRRSEGLASVVDSALESSLKKTSTTYPSLRRGEQSPAPSARRINSPSRLAQTVPGLSSQRMHKTSSSTSLRKAASEARLRQACTSPGSSIRSLDSSFTDLRQFRQGRSNTPTKARSPATPTRAFSPGDFGDRLSSSLTFRNLRSSSGSHAGSTPRREKRSMSPDAWRPPPEPELPRFSSFEEDLSDAEGHDHWLGDKLYAEYRSFLENSRSFEGIWESASDLSSSPGDTPTADDLAKKAKRGTPRGQIPQNAAKRAALRQESSSNSPSPNPASGGPKSPSHSKRKKLQPTTPGAGRRPSRCTYID